MIVSPDFFNRASNDAAIVADPNRIALRVAVFVCCFKSKAFSVAVAVLPCRCNSASSVPLRAAVFSQYRIKRCTRQPRSRRCKYRVQRYPAVTVFCKMASMTPVRFIVFAATRKDRHLLLGLLEVSRQEPKKHPHPDSAKQQTQLSRLLRLVLQYRRERGRLGHVLLLQYGVNVRSQSDDFQQHRINRAGQREPFFSVSRAVSQSLSVLAFCSTAAKEPVTVYVVDPPPEKSTAYPVR